MIPESLEIGHKVKTTSWKWKIIAIQWDLAKVLVWGETIEVKKNTLRHVKENTKIYDSKYLDKVVAANPAIWKMVAKSNRETCAWNITWSTKLDDNLELLGFFSWIQKICLVIWLQLEMALPDLNDSNYKQKFANAATKIWKENIDKLLDTITEEYYKRFGNSPKYQDIGRVTHIYQFAKIVNSALQRTQMAKHNLDPEIFKLSDEKFIELVAKKSGRAPLVVNVNAHSEEEFQATIDGIIGYIKGAEDFRGNMN